MVFLHKPCKTMLYNGSAETWQRPRGSASLVPFHSPLWNYSDSADIGTGSMRGGEGTCGSGVGGCGDNEGHGACRDMSGAVVWLLLEKHADVNTQGGLYGDALQVASYGSHEAVVRSGGM